MQYVPRLKKFPAIAAGLFLLYSTAHAAPPTGFGSPMMGGTSPAGNQREDSPPRPTSRPAIQLPEVDMASLNSAKHDATAAHAELAKAQAALTHITQSLQEAVLRQADLSEATEAVAAAKQDYHQTTEPILSSLMNQPAYIAATASVDSAQQHLDELKGSANVIPADRLAAASVLLNAKQNLTKLQNEALAASTEVTTSRQNYAAAVDALNTLKQKYADSVKQDASWQSAKSAFDAAKTRAAEADTKLADAQQSINAKQSARAAALAEQHERDHQTAYRAGLPSSN